jgi:hypothetical protein
LGFAEHAVAEVNASLFSFLSRAPYSFSVKLYFNTGDKTSGLRVMRTMGMEMTGGGPKRIYV